MFLAACTACGAAESTDVERSVSVDQVLENPTGYQGGSITLHGSAGQIGWSRVPRALEPSWALVPPGGGPGLAVIGADDPGLGAWVELHGELRVDRFDGIPYLDATQVHSLEELPMWQRPLDRQTLMAALAILLPPTGFGLLAVALRAKARELPRPSREEFARCLPSIAGLDAGDLTEPIEHPAATAGGLTFEVLAGPDIGRRFLIYADRVTIGRRPDRDIALTDPCVARYEATVTQRDGRVVIRAESSHTVVLVNGQAITEAPLHSGDRVRIGGTDLRLELASPSPAGAPAPEAS